MKSTRYLVISILAFLLLTASAIWMGRMGAMPQEYSETLHSLSRLGFVAAATTLVLYLPCLTVGKEASLKWLKVGETYKLIGNFEGEMSRLVVIKHVKSGKTLIFNGYGFSVLGRCLMNVTKSGTKFVWTYTKPWKTEGESGASHGGYEAKIVEDAPPSEEQQLKRLRGSGHETPATSDESWT